MIDPLAPTRPAFVTPRPFIPVLVGDRKSRHDEQEDRSDERITTLVERAREGDKESFGVLYRLYYPAIARLARFSLGGSVEDVVAETFTRAWAGLPRYKTTSVPFVAWLYAIARNVVVDELRARRRTEPREHLPDTSVDSQYERDLALAAAIRRLPNEQRKVIELKYLVGLTNPEVAAALNKTIGAVNAQQWRALQSLRESLR